jgi:hypothetical protein
MLDRWVNRQPEREGYRQSKVRASGVGPGRQWRGLGEEIGATLAAAGRTTTKFWLLFGIF